ncbi:MAG: DUF3467 domain-containing protein [Acidobacteria bacterium]|nr:DUF3467 domain-containing protein [Acidobacteriota bacterium]MBV9147705.1 DUF3467 domain-containing protein [Acidobacteriota bacterium]MBV9435406.1 DUF3467 domain-containing protein [Acidobacteriota bacterium]
MAEEIKFVPAPDGIIEVYSNYVFINWSMTDIRIRFAQLIPVDEVPGHVSPDVAADRIAQERAAVTVSWLQAKNLRDLLNLAVSRYEAKNGEIKLLDWPI